MRININYILMAMTLSLGLSCKSFLEIEPPKTSVSTETVFSSNSLATAAVLNMYTTTFGSSSLTSGARSLTFATGVSSDELLNYESVQDELFENELQSNNMVVTSLYTSSYNGIYKANTVLEGLLSSTALSPKENNQLKGEALFVRSFCYFQLVNLFGPVPLQLTSDYTKTRVEPRASIDAIYQQIVADLLAAELLLDDAYISTERVRANRASVQALLARIFLYRKDWVNAQKYASLVIGKATIYNLLPLDNVFLKNSQETILQSFPNVGTNGGDGQNFILIGTPTYVSLRPGFVTNAFEANDKRRTSWVQTFTNNTGTYYYPFKYKVRTATTPSEYTTLLRLAEQYLIRAEALAEQNKLSEAIDDLDKIRDRAGLIKIQTSNPSISQAELLAAIYRERRVELFAEQGHRWMDLKRLGKATEVLSPIKANWQPFDALYPIPFNEINKNPNITQNAGYE